MKDIVGTIRHVLPSAAILAVAILLGGCDHARASGEPVEPQETVLRAAFDQVIILGDSIMSHSYDAVEGKNYTSTMAHRLAAMEYKVANLSRPGNGVYNSFQDEAWGGINTTAIGSTAIVITLGTNDWAFWLDVVDFKQHYVHVLSKILLRSWDQEVFCMTPLPTTLDDTTNEHGQHAEEYRQAVREIADGGYCTLIETQGLFSQSEVFDGYHFPDGVHPGNAAHERLTHHVLNYLAVGRHPR